MQHYLLTNKIKVIMENKYQSLLGIIRSNFGKQLSMYSFLDYVREGTLSTDDVRDFVKGVCDALDMNDWADVLDNVLRCRVEQCGILRRLIATERGGKIRYAYYAGQDYPSEVLLVRKILRTRCRRP